MFSRYLFFNLAFFCSFSGFSQHTYTVSGYVKDKSNGEVLIAATVSVPDKKAVKMSNEYGFYSLTLPEDSIVIVCEHPGYQKIKKKIFLNRNITLDFEMEARHIELQEVIIQGERPEEKIQEAQMSKVNITPREARLIPVLFGETDLLKTLQLKPGIQSGGEGTTGLYVRGGGPDQNLFLLDEAIVYNPSHLFGLFSIFNADAVKNIDLYKGDFPAVYGGRLSSVIDVKLNEGNKRRYGATGGVGLIASRLTVEGPVQKEKSSFIISARRTYFDILTRQINNLNSGRANYSPIPDYYFYDLNGKINFVLSPKDKIFFSAYLGNDVFGYRERNYNFDFRWGNITSTLRWTRIFSPKLFSGISLIYSDYKYNIHNRFNNFFFTLGSGIRNYTLKSDFYYSPGKNHTIKFGSLFTRHGFSVGRLQAGTEDGKIAFESGARLSAADMSVYISDEMDVSARWKFNNGIRFSGFVQQGKFYGGLEPRSSARYMLSDNASLKASFARMYQYVHLVSNSGASLPTDIWYPSGEAVRPQRSDQVAAGFQKLLFNSKYMFSNEVYHKWMKGQIDFRDGAQLFVNPDLEQEFVFGKGWAYGNEIYLEKKEGKTTGWIGYTLSWAWRKFDEINDGNRFPARYDRRHDVSIVTVHRFTERLSVSGTWVYGTGNAVTLPVGRILFQDVPGSFPSVVPDYIARNSFRMPSYHRMDLGLVWKFQPKKGESDLTLSVYNAYNRRNAYFIYYDEVTDGIGNTVKFQAKQVSLFPVIPSLTYNFRY